MTNVNPLQAAKLQIKNHHHESAKSGKHEKRQGGLNNPFFFRVFVINFLIRPLVIRSFAFHLTIELWYSTLRITRSAPDIKRQKVFAKRADLLRRKL